MSQYYKLFKSKEDFENYQKANIHYNYEITNVLPNNELVVSIYSDDHFDLIETDKAYVEFCNKQNEQLRQRIKHELDIYYRLDDQVQKVIDEVANSTAEFELLSNRYHDVTNYEKEYRTSQQNEKKCVNFIQQLTSFSKDAYQKIITTGDSDINKRFLFNFELTIKQIERLYKKDKIKSENFAKLVDDIQKIQKQIDTTTNAY